MKTGRRPTHGDCSRNGKRTKEYMCWSHIIQRCINPKVANYKNYGARGITVCERWLVYENFLADVGRAPSPKHSIDRINTNGNYEPGNCRWATTLEQQRNRTNNIVLTHDNKTLTVSEWAEIYGINKRIIVERIKRGWDVELSLTAPKGHKPCTFTNSIELTRE